MRNGKPLLSFEPCNKAQSTRKHYPFKHLLSIVVNRVVKAETEVTLRR